MLFIFWMKEVGKLLDVFTKVLGVLMILLTLYVAISSHPPITEAITRSILPTKIDVQTIVTLVGGTVGGYISFSGAHRLLDANIKGVQQIQQVNKSAVSGIVITGIMRTVLFLAALGVVTSGAVIDPSNPPASVFKIAAGNLGYRFFGIVMWSAAITSVVGAAYTSVSFLKTFHPFFEKYQKQLISGFIIFSTLVFVIVGNPIHLLVMAGALNGLILPVALAVILIAASNKTLLKNYVHPFWMQLIGWLVVIAMTALCVMTIYKWITV